MVKSSDAGSRNRVLGIWDLGVSPISLGGLLILVEELKIQCLLHHARSADVCIVGNTSTSAIGEDFQHKESTFHGTEGQGENASSVLSILYHLEGIGSCYSHATPDSVREFISKHRDRYIPWPVITDEERIVHKYASMRFVNAFYHDNGYIPYLSCIQSTLLWGSDFLTRHVGERLPVVVHLKNVRLRKGQSNADVCAWRQFMKGCVDRYDAEFVLIGKDPVDEEMSSLPNVTIAREAGSNLGRDLALIQSCFMFMGMSSGPCNMAILGEVPYVIFKNPDHDAEQMEEELGFGGNFSFAGPLQRFLRRYETVDDLMSEFDRTFRSVDRLKWEARAAALR